VLFRFIDADSDEAALKVDTACAEQIPRPPSYQPPFLSSSVEAAK
jgi:hypothetical protein